MDVFSALDSADAMPNDGTGKYPRNQPCIFPCLFVTGVIKLDPWLDPFKGDIKYRVNEAQKWIKKINDTEGGLETFSRVSKMRLWI